MSRPWYRWWVEAYQAETKLLSDQADLLYRRMLDEYWIRKELPNSAGTLQKLCRYSARKFHKYYPEIESFFVQKDGYLIHPKMEEEIANAVDISTKNRENVNKRWAYERNTNVDTIDIRRRNTINKNKNKNKKKGKRATPATPDFSKIKGLNMEAWKLWEQYRKSRKFSKYVDTRIANRLAKIDSKEQMQCVQNSIDQKYKGIFPEDWQDKVDRQKKYTHRSGNGSAQTPRPQPPEINRHNREPPKKWTQEERKNAKKLMQKAMAEIKPDKPKPEPEKPPDHKSDNGHDPTQRFGDFMANYVKQKEEQT